MLFIKGVNTIRIKKYTDNQHKCPSCGVYDLQLKVYKAYFHVCYIPFIPTDVKSSKIICNNCSQPIRIDSLQKHYEEITKIPFFLYTGLILIGGFIASMFGLSAFVSYQQSEYTKQPQVGDVFEIKNIGEKEFISYYFLRVNTVNSDSIKFYRNHLLYLESTSKFEDNDFFEKDDTVSISKKVIQDMDEKGNIITVQRTYGTNAGFNKILMLENK